GHFGMPHMDGKPATVNQYQYQDREVITAMIPGRKIALITYNGWDKVCNLVHQGRNAEAEESTVLYAYRKRIEKNPAIELMISVMLHSTDGGEWTEEELSPIKEIRIMDVMPSHSVLGAEIRLADNRTYIIDFKDIDGYKSC
ncbi:MAG: hypothetical protein GX796_10550, partial [Clostridiaceae bacterium]|nr:hypothetical protein [Clostridiaceae bacterium]